MPKETPREIPPENYEISSSDRGDSGLELKLASHCQFCGRRLEKDAYHFTCHVCGANYCYIHLRRHDGAHPRMPQVISQR